MLIYISGAITNDFDHRKKFETAKTYLMKKGHEVINPVEVGDELPLLKHEQYLHIDKSLIDICDAVYFLKDWGSSEGAREEYGYCLDRINAENKEFKNAGIMACSDFKLIFESENKEEL